MMMGRFVTMSLLRHFYNVRSNEKKQERSGDCTYEIDMGEAIYCFAQ